MGVVRGEHVEARIALLDDPRDRLGRKRGEPHLAQDVLAGRQGKVAGSECRPPHGPIETGGEIKSAEEARHPCGALLDHAHPQIRVAIEYPVENKRRECHLDRCGQPDDS